MPAMTIPPAYLLLYFTPLMLIWGLYAGMRTVRYRRNRAARDAAFKAGLTNPSSRYPVINHNRCRGCGACVAACPEHPGHQVLGLINCKSHLIGPSECIGHGACADACPNQAITLVYGTKDRGFEMPWLDENLQTSVPGIYIAGELGGAGLIASAMEKGCEAMESIRKLDGMGSGPDLDVIIVGAGPAGLAASLYARKHGMRYLTLEREEGLGGTVAMYPRGKLVMTRPVELPLAGTTPFTETTKEELMSYFQALAKKGDLKIKFREEMNSIEKTGKGFEVSTSRASYKARAVLIAIGRRGTPRKLGVCGEEDCKVVYRLSDPEDYRAKRVLVVGGGDSALEAATSIAAFPDTEVSISYRSGAFSRAKVKNRQKVEKANADGRLRLLMKTTVKEISPSAVKLDHDGKEVELKNDSVIVCAGGILPTGSLKKIGIQVETKHGTP